LSQISQTLKWSELRQALNQSPSHNPWTPSIHLQKMTNLKIIKRILRIRPKSWPNSNCSSSSLKVCLHKNCKVMRPKDLMLSQTWINSSKVYPTSNYTLLTSNLNFTHRCNSIWSTKIHMFKTLNQIKKESHSSTLLVSNWLSNLYWRQDHPIKCWPNNNLSNLHLSCSKRVVAAFSRVHKVIELRHFRRLLNLKINRSNWSLGSKGSNSTTNRIHRSIRMIQSILMKLMEQSSEEALRAFKHSSRYPLQDSRV